MGAGEALYDLRPATYNIPEKKYKRSGLGFVKKDGIPTYVNAIVLRADGNVYNLARFQHNGQEVEDLVKINVTGKK